MNTAALLIALVCSVGFVAATPSIVTSNGHTQMEGASVILRAGRANIQREGRDALDVFQISEQLDDGTEEIGDMKQYVDDTSASLSALSSVGQAALTTFGRVDNLIQRSADQETAMTVELAETQAATGKMLADAGKSFETMREDRAKVISDSIAKALASVDQVSADLDSRIKAMQDSPTSADACGKKGDVYTGDACVATQPDSLMTLPLMYYTKFNNDDGRDSGWLNNRWLRFKKHYGDETTIKVTYYDNMRVHGWGHCHGMWEVYFCDNNGNGCQQCTNPGRVNFWKYSHQAHNYWMNDHIGYTAVGYCKQAGNRKLEKGGAYMLKVQLHDQRCDMYTGSSGQVGSLQAEEVLLQN
jgi:hypothetical protein